MLKLAKSNKTRYPWALFWLSIGAQQRRDVEDMRIMYKSFLGIRPPRKQDGLSQGTRGRSTLANGSFQLDNVP